MKKSKKNLLILISTPILTIGIAFYFLFPSYIGHEVEKDATEKFKDPKLSKTVITKEWEKLKVVPFEFVGGWTEVSSPDVYGQYRYVIGCGQSFESSYFIKLDEIGIGMSGRIDFFPIKNVEYLNGKLKVDMGIGSDPPLIFYFVTKEKTVLIELGTNTYYARDPLPNNQDVIIHEDKDCDDYQP